ncbi:hypothetical protein [Streptomyces sp. NPDC007264]|uniref:hypothetical protein n=1 Tax=Streptomyces sp. NPDC007264 TaxID=3364777 RepID=UPI0036D783C5
MSYPSSPSPSPDFGPPAAPAPSVDARDRGVRRLRGLTRWITVAAVAGAAALGAVYTHLLPAGSASPAAPAGPPVPNPAAPPAAYADDDEHEEHGGTGGHEDDDGDEDEGTGTGTAPAARPGLQAPAQPPAPTRQQPHATTGAS